MATIHCLITRCINFLKVLKKSLVKISKRLTLGIRVTLLGQFYFPDSLTRFAEARRKYISARDVTSLDREVNARNMRNEYRSQGIKQNCKLFKTVLTLFLTFLHCIFESINKFRVWNRFKKMMLLLH